MPDAQTADKSSVRKCFFRFGAYITLLATVPAAQQKPADAIRQQLAAAQVQREAVRKQAELAAQYRIAPGTSLVPASDCDPLPPAEITPLVDAAAQGNHVQTALLRSVIEQESGGRPCAVSVKGAQGLMQLMPATIEQFHVDDAFDARQNVEAGAQFLKQLLDKYKGNLSLALAAYNSGPATVDLANGIPDIKETRDYVESILRKLKSDTPKEPVPPN
jgi:soluble lytic murein transglycosylase-like protein